MIPATVRLDRRRVLGVAVVLQLLVLAAIYVETVGLDLSVVRPVIVVAYLTFVPGLLLIALLELDHDLGTVLGYAVGLSLIAIMVIGGLASLIGPYVGFAEPLRPLSIALMLGVTVGILSLMLYRFDFQFELRIPVGDALSPFPLALLLLPFASILGTVYMALTDSNLVLLGFLIAISALPVALVWWVDTERWYTLAVWTVSVALLYHSGLLPFTAGHQLSSVAVEQGRWIPNYGEGMGSLLPNGVLYPTYAQLADVPISIEFEVINPFLISLLPVFLFLAFRRQTDSRKGLIGTCLFMFSFPFYSLYPIGGRVSTPVFFLALIALAVSDDVPLTDFRRGLVLVFGAGVAVSHYGTAWVVMYALVISALLLLAIRVADNHWPGRESIDESKPTPELTDGGTAPAHLEVADEFKNQLLRPPFVAFYSASAMAWYLYTGNGGKFRTLPNHIINGMYEVLYGNPATGAATRSVTKDYGSTSIALSRQLYLLFGALMGIGILYVALKRVVRNERLVEDEFLALGAGFLAILGTAFLPFSTGFNTARVMMIVFVFTAPFMTFGADAIVEAFASAGSAVSGRLSRIPSLSIRFDDFALPRDRAVAVGLSSLLAVFLLLNTGVAAELVIKDHAPTNSVSEQRLLNSDDPIERSRASECLGCQIQTHVWIIEHKRPDWTAYGDFQVAGQIDYFRGEITAQLGSVPSQPYANIWDVRNGTEESSYLIFRPYNTGTGGVVVTGKYDWREFNQSKDVVRDANRIYTAGGSNIYLTRNLTGATNATARVNASN